MNHVLNPIYEGVVRGYYNNRKILTKKGTKSGIYYSIKELEYKGKIVIDGRRLKEAENAEIYEGVRW